MEFYSSTYSADAGNRLISEKISPFLDQISTRSSYDKKKKTELRHTGKFLAYFFPHLTIEKIYERPDFLIRYKKRIIGLEHTELINYNIKRQEGYIKNVFNEAENRLLKEESKDYQNMHNCYIKSDFNYKKHPKKEIIKTIISLIKHYQKEKCVFENFMIDQIAEFPHSSFDLIPLFNSNKQSPINKEIILKAVKKKEKKISEYIKNSTDEQWLLLVISNSGRSGYDVKDDFQIELNSPFEHIYLLEDYENNLFKIR
jgi:hypothetical protein